MIYDKYLRVQTNELTIIKLKKDLKQYYKKSIYRKFLQNSQFRSSGNMTGNPFIIPLSITLDLAFFDDPLFNLTLFLGSLKEKTKLCFLVLP